MVTPQQQIQQQQSEALSQQITQVEAQRAKIQKDVVLLQESIQRSQEATGSTPRATQEILNQTSEEFSRLSSQLNILRDSQSLAEASARQSFFQRQQTAEQIRQEEQKALKIGDVVQTGPNTFVTRDVTGRLVEATKAEVLRAGGIPPRQEDIPRAATVFFGGAGQVKPDPSTKFTDIIQPKPGTSPFEQAIGVTLIPRGKRPIEFRDTFVSEVQPAPERGFFTQVIEAPGRGFEFLTGRTPGEAAVFVTGGEPSGVEGEIGAELIERGKGLVEVGGQVIGFPITVATQVGKAQEEVRIKEELTGVSERFQPPTFGTSFDFVAPQIPITTDEASIDFAIEKSKEREETIKNVKILFGGDVEAIAKEENLRLELELRKSAIRIENQLKEKFEKRIISNRNKIQEDIDSGKITLFDGQRQLDNFIVEENKKFGNQFSLFIGKISKTKQDSANKRLENLSKKAALKTALVTLPITIAIGAGLGFAAGASRVAAVGLTSIGAGTIIIEAPQITKATLGGDLLPLTTAAVQFAGFGIGGIIGARFGARISGKNIEAETINAAIERASTRSNVIGKNLNILKIAKFSKTFENRIKNLVDEGFNVNLIETRLVPRSTTDGKIIPDVRGLFVEITARDGTLIERIGLGRVVSKQKGKTFTRDIISRGEGKIQQDTLTILTRLEVFELKKKGLQKVDEVQILEEIAIREKIKKPEEFKIETIADIDIGLVEPQIIGLELPQVLKKAKEVAKPKAKAEVVLEEVFTDISLEVTPISRPVVEGIDVKFADIITGKTLGVVRGKAISEPIISEQLTKAELRASRRQEIKERRAEQKRKKEIEEFNKNLNKVSAIEILTPERIAKTQETLAKVVSIPDVLIKRVAKAVTKVKPKVTVKEAQMFVQPQDITQIQDFSATQEQKQVNRQLQNLSGTLSEKQFQDITAKQEQKQFQKQLDAQLLRQQQAQKQFQKQLQAQGIDFTVRIPPFRPKIPPVFTFEFEEDPVVKKIRRSNKPHDVFVKTKGKRVKIADNVMGNIALDLGSNVTDRSLAAEFSIKESKGKIKEPPFRPPKNYWDFNQNKFRPFRIKMGRKIPLKNTWIEKMNRRLDSAGERNQISVARLLAQQTKRNTQMSQMNKAFGNIFGGTSKPKKKTKKKK